MQTYTTINANLNSADYRSTQPRKIFYRCDLCNERPGVWHVHRIEGARVITATVCHECRKVWEASK